VKIEHQDTATCPGESKIIPPALLKDLNKEIRNNEWSRDLQFPLDRFISDDIKEIIFDESLRYPERYQKTVRNYLSCGKVVDIKKCPEHNHGCDYEIIQPHLCHSRYCSYEVDVEARISQALKRLNSFKSFPKSAIKYWNKYKTDLINDPDNSNLSEVGLSKHISRKKTQFFESYMKKHSHYGFNYDFPDRLYHFTIGSNRVSKSELNRVISVYMRRMRLGHKRKHRKAYSMHYLKVFDIGKKNYETMGLLYLHYHIALLPEFNSGGISEFMETSRSVLQEINPDVVFNNIGFRKSKSIFRYFAQRNAGKLGHKKDHYYYYDNIMTFPTYIKLFYNTKLLTYHLPEWLVYIKGTSLYKCECPIHHLPLDFYASINLDLIKAQYNGVLPYKFRFPNLREGEKSVFKVVSAM